ncbi:hypothetical protein Droror1_Dr00018114 [Drosera rotundifolia]
MLDPAPPPPAIADYAISNLIKMGFPQRSVEGVIAICLCHKEAKIGGYSCPRCKARICDLPTECRICGLTLVSSPHLTRSYHHLFPITPFNEVAASQRSRQRVPQTCFGCQQSLLNPGNISSLCVTCPKCQRYFCLDCDIYIHESLHNCPGCERVRNSKSMGSADCARLPQVYGAGFSCCLMKRFRFRSLCLWVSRGYRVDSKITLELIKISPSTKSLPKSIPGTHGSKEELKSTAGMTADQVTTAPVKAAAAKYKALSFIPFSAIPSSFNKSPAPSLTDTDSQILLLIFASSSPQFVISLFVLTMAESTAESKDTFSSDEVTSVMGIIASTGKFWNEWDELKSILSFQLKQCSRVFLKGPHSRCRGFVRFC